MTNPISEFNDSMLLDVLALSKDATAVYTSEDLHIRFANDVMLRFWDKGREIIGKPLGEAVPVLQGQPFLGMLQNVWRTGVTCSDTNTPANLLVNGEPIILYFDFEYRAIKNQAGATYCILHTASDVTERVKTQQELREKVLREKELIADLSASNEKLAAVNEEQESANEELLAANEELADAQLQLILSSDRLMESENRIRNVLEQAPVGIAVLRGPEHIIDIANQTILDIWGRTEKDVLKKPHKQARTELSGQPVFDWLDEVFKTGTKRVNREINVMLYHNGGLRKACVNSIYQPLKDVKGVTTGVLVILEDVTEAVNARQQAVRVQDMFNLAIEAGELGTFYYDPKTNLFSGNDLLKSWFGLQPDDYIDLDMAISVIAESDRKKVVAAIQNVLTYGTGGSYDIEYAIINPKAPQPRIVRAKGKAHFNDQHEPVSLNGTVQDITEPKRDEQRKNDFIAMVSHELKTPLTSLSGYIQILQKKLATAPEQPTTGILNKALKQANKMTDMINGFLNMSRLESGKISIDRKRVDLAILVKEVEEALIPEATTHKIIFKPVQETWVNVDKDKIEQVINNFISNAIKYSPANTTIHIACVTVNGKASVSVSDEGMGIKQADIPHLFDRFYRVEDKQMQSISGFGIGLYLSKEIIDRHDGEIGVDSTPGEGSTFWFNLPTVL